MRGNSHRLWRIGAARSTSFMRKTCFAWLAAIWGTCCARFSVLGEDLSREVIALSGEQGYALKGKLN